MVNNIILWSTNLPKNEIEMLSGRQDEIDGKKKKGLNPLDEAIV